MIDGPGSPKEGVAFVENGCRKPEAAVLHGFHCRSRDAAPDIEELSRRAGIDRCSAAPHHSRMSATEASHGNESQGDAVKPVAWWRVLWSDFPLVSFVACSLVICITATASLDPARPDFSFTFLFPLVVPVLVYSLRWRSSSQVERRVAVSVLCVAALFLSVNLTFVWRYPLSNAAIRTIFEAGGIAQALILGLHAFSRGRGVLAMFFAATLLYGVVLENGGILLGYFSEPGFRLYVGPLPAPVTTMLGWVSAFYMVTWAAWAIGDEVPAIGRRPALLALTATAAALLLDLHIDPFATASEFWIWNGILPRNVMGVPLLNFVAWTAAILPFSYLIFRRQHQFALTPVSLCTRRHISWVVAMTPVVLMAASLLFLAIMLVVEGSVHGPAFVILREALFR